MTSPDTKEIGLGAVAQKLEETVRRLRDESEARKGELQSERLDRKKSDRQLELTTARANQLEQERDLLLAQVKELEADLEGSGSGGAALGKQSAEVEAARVAVERAAAARDESLEKQAELQRDNERLEAAVKELTSDLNGLRNGADQAVSGAEEELEALRDFAQNSREQLEQVAARLTQCGFDAETLPLQTEALLGRLTEVEEELHATRHELTESATLPSADPGLAKELETAQSELVQLKERAQAQEALAAEAKERGGTAETELENLRSEHGELDEKLALLQGGLDTQKLSLDASQERVENLELELSASRERCEDLERQAVAAHGGAMAPVSEKVIEGGASAPGELEANDPDSDLHATKRKSKKGKEKKGKKEAKENVPNVPPSSPAKAAEQDFPVAEGFAQDPTDDGEVALLSAEDIAEIPEPRDPDEEPEVGPSALRDQILGGEGMIDPSLENGDSSSSALDEERAGEEAIGLRRQRDSGSQSILHADDEEVEEDAPAPSRKAVVTPKPPPPQNNGADEIDLSGCLGKEDDPGAEKFAVMVKDGATLVRTPRFGKIDLVNRLDIQVSDWLEVSSSWDDIQNVSGGKMAEQKLLEVMYLFFQRDLFRIRT